MHDVNPEHWTSTLSDLISDLAPSVPRSQVTRVVELIDNIVRSRINETLDRIAADAKKAAETL